MKNSNQWKLKVYRADRTFLFFESGDRTALVEQMWSDLPKFQQAGCIAWELYQVWED